MEKEILIDKVSSITLNVTANKIDSYRSKEETQNTVRVYQDGKIGVAGSLGEFDEEALTKSAEEALSYGIEYPCDLSANVRTIDKSKEIISKKDFIPTMQRLLDRLAKECPKFAVSHKIHLVHAESVYKNSRGADLKYAGDELTLELLFQSKGSGNLMDCFYGGDYEEYDEEKIFLECKEIYDGFYNNADIEEGEYPVFFESGEPLLTMGREFLATSYASGSSLLSGKLGQKIFNEKLTFASDGNPDTNLLVTFFDAEGEIGGDDLRQNFIKDGVFTNVITSKKFSKMLGVPKAATASADYDEVPSMGYHRPYLKPTAKTVTEVAPDKAVLVIMMSGGDMTPDGHFATPVQTSFLVENGKIVGKLPDISVSGEFFDLLGKDYLGTVENAFFPMTKVDYMCCKMKVSK